MHPVYVVALALLLFCGDLQCLHADAPNPIQEQPTRIVSLDYCADQYVLQFAATEDILALSPEAVREFSYLREQAQGFPTVRPIVEDVIAVKPDLVVRSYGGGFGIVEVLDQLEIPVVQIGYANTLAEVQQSVLSVSAALGTVEQGEQIVASMRKRLQEIKVSAGKVQGSALYTTPTGVTAGPGTLIHDILLAAGFDNFEDKPGWRALPLERLVYAGPDVVAQAFYQSAYGHRDLWSAAGHPVARRQLSNASRVSLDGAWTSCGAWFLMDAVEALFREHAEQLADAGQAVK
ncbi:MAG: ABC transporter substrate-binding protein [Pseudomonadaceae bacterium]|nr:ABC transporter substrate-binding protein [Pseudomonadaceae bacterium]